jgi:hypothetical protein
MTAHNGPLPVPARITMALDMRELYGPEVDRACGVEEPAVDEWELGLRVPTDAQMLALAELTHIPIAWFYRPASEIAGTRENPHRAMVCERDRRKHGLTIMESFVDERGVLMRRSWQPSRGETPGEFLPPGGQQAAAQRPEKRSRGCEKPGDFIPGSMPSPIDAVPSPERPVPRTRPTRRQVMAATRPGRRPVTVHPPVEDPDTPGVCVTCHRPTGAPNDAHGPLPDVPSQAAARTRVDPGDD